MGLIGRIFRSDRMSPKELIKEDGVEVAKYGDDQGTPKTRALSVEVTTIEKVGKRTERRAVRRVRDLLDRWIDQKHISEAQYAAGRRFQGQAHRAQINPSVTASFDRVSSSPGPVRLQDHILDANRLMGRTMDELGGHKSPMARAMWFCLGCDMTIAETARRVRWAGGNPHAIRGMIVSGLDVLKGFWRMR